MMNDFKALPQIESLLQDDRITEWIPKISRPLVANAVRETVEGIRNLCKENVAPVPSLEEIIRSARDACVGVYARRLRRVINGTGVILHTNMGRSPIPRAVWDHAENLNCGYSNLEFDLETGKRGGRSGLVPELVAALTGAEAAMVVNNNAGSLYLILSAFASGENTAGIKTPGDSGGTVAGTEVIVSRGEQVQIGGGFRIPEILRLSGARLVEVGTTNVTTVRDYVSAITPSTTMILMVHRSNFALRGFASSPDIRDISRVKPAHVILCVDQGSGTTGEKLPGEISVRTYIDGGADLVCFSGDKVLGGPQAGIIVGKKKLIAALLKHPLYRVCRTGKTISSLLEELLIRRLNGEPGEAARITGYSTDELKKRARRILRGLTCQELEIVASAMTTGGGSSPDESSPSVSIRLNTGHKPDDVLARLRECNPPIIGTIQDGLVQINVATLDLNDFEFVRNALRTLVQGGEGCTS